MNNPEKRIVAGLSTGIITTVIFNPVDKALYQSVKHKLPFLNVANWKQPYQGVSQALYSRIVGYGIYFSLFDIYTDIIVGKSNNSLNLIFASVMTGMSTSMLNHPINVIKMCNWTNNTGFGITKLAHAMYSKYGPFVFFRGLKYTILRDSTYSAIYFTASTKLNKDRNICVDSILGIFACSVSSPINYYRNSIFFDFDKLKTFSDITKELIHDIKCRGGNSTTSKIYHLYHDRFNVGYGTMRVGIGMAISKCIYDNVFNILDNK